MSPALIVSPQAWEAAREQLLGHERALTRARDALAAERRRMPWVAVAKAYVFDGPEGEASLVGLFEGRRQLIIYRAFGRMGVAPRGCGRCHPPAPICYEGDHGRAAQAHASAPTCAHGA